MPAISKTSSLRLATAGSVDDGKSTLIGRLLHDSKAILADQYDDLQGRDGELDLSRVTDGLRAEREQGITIDVAYRYFATPKRRFILADTPGHVQYTRNMVTGASNTDLAVVLIDARNGVVEQTRRHAFISSLLGIRHIAVAVNKMDLVDYSEERFDEIVRDFSDFREQLLATEDVRFFPISALDGDNVVDASKKMDWYDGPLLLDYLENVDVDHDRNLKELRFPVQLVIRNGATDYRGLAGTVSSGIVKPGDKIVVLPSGIESTVKSVDVFDGQLEQALPGESVTLVLEDDIDVSRGDLICHVDDRSELGREFNADVCWFSEQPLRAGSRYAIKHATFTSQAVIDELIDTVDIHTLERVPAPAELPLNGIGKVGLRTAKPLAFDPYSRNRGSGAFILIDEATNDTVAGGMIA
ncbi:MAG TPA: GTP-binding protein [Baekduia sp.]|nr:GTP-binding protein [Baekduia sp.]